MSSTKTIPIGTERCDVTITWDTGWKFTAKGRCTSIAIEAHRHPQAKTDNTNYTQPTII